MCQISDKIKFCTCAASSVNQLKHYWIWYSFNKHKNEMILGEMILPMDFIEVNYKKNQETLLDRLNHQEAFDKPLNFKNKDILEIGINNNAKDKEVIYYTFEFKKGDWQITYYDPFYIANNFDEKEFGKIKFALSRI